VNAKKFFVVSVAIIVFVAAVCFFTDNRRKSIDAGELARQLDLLDRERGARQRELEENLVALASLSDSAIAALDEAGKIVERTGSSLQTATTNLRDAKRILGGLASQIKDLQVELYNCRADLRRIRSLAGVESGQKLVAP
jgi:chromosome segregation ATPase